jgi:sialate O-acetylesterase
MMNISMNKMAGFCCMAFLCFGTEAAVTLASVFRDNMVLQREMPVPVWGKAEPGENVFVSFAGQKKSCKTGDDGRWMLKLDPLEANSAGQTLKVEGARECKNVVVGEVWLLSGQSNMGVGLCQSSGGREAVKKADYPSIRIMSTPKKESPVPVDDIEIEWKACSPKTAVWFSAIGFYFGRKLHEELKVPLGLMESSWAGSGIEPFIPAEGFAQYPELSGLAKNNKNVSMRYNYRIHPLIPFPIRGVLWYQGETNGTDQQYALKQKAMIESWRKKWGYDFPFYYVQIANWENEKQRPAYLPVAGVAIVREQQLKAMQVPKTGMAVTVDIGGDLHPKNKLDVGLRLARWALHNDYGRKEVVVSGPLYKGFKVDGGKVMISFDYSEHGLVSGKKPAESEFENTADEPLHEFEIAGDDKKWHTADAVIDGRTVIVSSPDVPNPVAVRYAFCQNPKKANLYNKDGLPASPFRTDDWPLSNK